MQNKLGLSTGMDTMLRTTRFDENFEVDESQRHESKGETSHETSEANQSNDEKYVEPEFGFTARCISGHISLYGKSLVRKSAFSLAFQLFFPTKPLIAMPREHKHYYLTESNAFCLFLFFSRCKLGWLLQKKSNHVPNVKNKNKKIYFTL